MLEWIDVFTTVALGLFLRFGIPLAVTGFLVWWLRRIDLQWQVQAEEIYRAPQNAVIVRPHCWEARQCSQEMRERCAAYLQNDLPCWQVMRQAKGRLQDRCLECKVFRDAPAPQLQPAH